MRNITRFDPFNEVVRFDPFRSIDDFFCMPQLPVFRAVAEKPDMRMDLSEDDGNYYVKAEMPGTKKEDIHVAIDGCSVSISTEVRKENEVKKGETVLRNERYYGRWARNFTLGHEVDETKDVAKYAEGIL